MSLVVVGEVLHIDPLASVLADLRNHELVLMVRTGKDTLAIRIGGERLSGLIDLAQLAIGDIAIRKKEAS